jgi:hypothetical protein
MGANFSHHFPNIFSKKIPSIEEDHLIYRHDGKTASCLVKTWSGCVFPRRLISVSGFVVEVEEIGRDPQALRVDEVLLAICIPSSVEKICESCFNGCKSLSTITFESGSKLSCIENDAFCNCSSLSSIGIPSSVEQICRECFNGCYSLSTITFESDSKLSCIERSAFCNCLSLSSICIPSSLEKICQGCFYGCNSLSTIRF